MICTRCKKRCYRGGLHPMIMLWTGRVIVCEDCFFKGLENRYGNKKEEEGNEEKEAGSRNSPA